MLRQFTVYRLEVDFSDEIDFDIVLPNNIQIVPVNPPDAEINQYFYHKIGYDWDWIDRRFWTTDEWVQYINRTELETWLVKVDGIIAGYFELLHEPDQSIQIAYLGLLPEFTGKKIGSLMTRFALKRSLSIGAKRVWLSTCSLDHPAALKTYQKCGFKIVSQEEISKTFPDE